MRITSVRTRPVQEAGYCEIGGFERDPQLLKGPSEADSSL